jgi:hypothetical protein
MRVMGDLIPGKTAPGAPPTVIQSSSKRRECGVRGRRRDEEEVVRYGCW